MKIVDGNILEVKTGYIVQQCNCTTLLAYGLSLMLEKTFPGTCPYFSRRPASRGSKVAKEEDRGIPGTIDLAQYEDVIIVNLFGQYHPGGPKFNGIDTAENRHQYFRDGLESLVEFLEGQEKTVEIAFPYGIGCGLAKGNWQIYQLHLEEFEKKLIERNIKANITIYRIVQTI